MVIDEFAGRLDGAGWRVAPNARLRFIHQGEKEVERLRNGQADLDISATGAAGPEIKVQHLSATGLSGPSGP